VYYTLARRFQGALEEFIRRRYSVEAEVAVSRPPRLDLGEMASPVCLQLARTLKRAPRQIAEEIRAELGPIEGIARIEIAGAGYLNAFLDRAAFWRDAQKESTAEAGASTVKRPGKVIVEHTSINPNKAAHIGHVRNAVLGDTMARILRHVGHSVQIQNYIDNTGVQVADVVIGFLRMEQRTPVSVKMLALEPKFDYLCWDLYAKTTNFFGEDKARADEWRTATLKAIEEGRGEDAEVAEVVADAIVGCHLRTMARLGITYELLARESEILHLHFWDLAFAKLKESGAIQHVTSGKMAGCWVIPWTEESKEKKKASEVKEKPPAAEGAETEEEENTQDKIIVRSNGTVTYVGKDIAYQLWKFGLLGKDFHYSKWPNAPQGQTVWATTSSPGDPAAPHFGEPAIRVYNVIDTRQEYPQDVVAQGLRGLGHAEAAENSIHLSYERLVLTPRCAAEMGYELSADEAKWPYVEVSGRKGLGVKADDLLDRLETATRNEVAQRHPEMSAVEKESTAHKIAIGALRYFLLKFTRTAIIAFDFKDALSFEGETGPYCQYAVVRIRGIRRKGMEHAAESETLMQESAAVLLNGAEGESFWELVLLAGSLDHAMDAAVGAQEPAFVAKFAFQLAQAFNLFYHKHHILSEPDSQKKAFLLSLTELVERQLVAALVLLGIEAPEKM
jgi:arginyl-tRNA synthetase